MRLKRIDLGLSAASACAIALVLGCVPAFAATPVAGEGLNAEGLPDGRVFEMVTPPVNENVEPYVPLSFQASGEETSTRPQAEENGIETTLPFQAAADGEAVAYAGGPSGEGSGVGGVGNGNEYLAQSNGSGGWSQTNLQPRGVVKASYQAFSPDLSSAILDSWTALTPGAPENNNMLYRRESTSGSYSALFGLTPPASERFLWTVNAYNVPSFLGFILAYSGESADERHLLFAANNALNTSAVDGGEAHNNLYDVVGGVPVSVNVLPNGTPAPNAAFGAPAEEEAAFDAPAVSHAISASGARIFWSSLDEAGQPSALYVRENDEQPQSPLDGEGHCTVPSDACTVQLDLTHGSGESGKGRFWTASSDGSVVFFTDENQLTADSTAAPGAPDLYEYDLESGTLTDLTVSASPGEPANVKGVVGASEDGSWVYFVAAGALAEGATTQPCEAGEAGYASGCNLYVRHEGVTRLIAVLAAKDGTAIAPYGPNKGNGNHGDWQPGLGNRTAAVTPDGTHLVFMSSRSLTGYANEGMAEIYLYDAEGAALSCLSCDASGEAPPAREFSLTAAAAAYLPVSNSATYAPRWISEDGDRVFFDSVEPLVAGASNGLQNVYEWEREGSGSCTSAEGCIYLLSAGTSPAFSWLLDASANGDDAFMITRATLSRQDENGAFDVYDARVGGVAAPAGEGQVSCSGTACQGPLPAAPSFGAPPSTAATPGGNLPQLPPPPAPKAKPKPKPLTRAQKLAKELKACAKKPKRKRASCRAQAERRYGTKKHRKAAGR